MYKTVSDGTEDEGYITTKVYALRTEKPMLFFKPSIIEMVKMERKAVSP